MRNTFVFLALAVGVATAAALPRRPVHIWSHDDLLALPTGAATVTEAETTSATQEEAPSTTADNTEAHQHLQAQAQVETEPQRVTRRSNRYGSPYGVAPIGYAQYAAPPQYLQSAAPQFIQPVSVARPVVALRAAPQYATKTVVQAAAPVAVSAPVAIAAPAVAAPVAYATAPAAIPVATVAAPLVEVAPAAEPYSFGYASGDEYGNQQERQEASDQNGRVTGAYAYRDAAGLYRTVEYVADENGFRAVVRTNEPGVGKVEEDPASTALELNPTPQVILQAIPTAPALVATPAAPGSYARAPVATVAAPVALQALRQPFSIITVSRGALASLRPLGPLPVPSPAGPLLFAQAAPVAFAQAAPLVRQAVPVAVQAAHSSGGYEAQQQQQQQDY